MTKSNQVAHDLMAKPVQIHHNEIKIIEEDDVSRVMQTCCHSFAPFLYKLTFSGKIFTQYHQVWQLCLLAKV
jgi:hypothetical protein